MDESFVLVQHPPTSASGPFPFPSSSRGRAWVQLARSTRPSQPDHLLAIDHLLALAGAQSLQDSDSDSDDDDDRAVDRLVAQLQLLAQPDQPNPLVAKSCLYYLALALALARAPLDAAARDQQESDEAHRYAADALLLPLAFRLAVRALHALDTGHYPEAVAWLAHPAVTPDFVPRTIALLATAPDQPPHSRARLVLDYWTLAQIDLELYSVREARYVVQALCAPDRKRGVAQAWNLARDWPRTHERPQLFTAILETCFGDNYTGLACAHHLSALLPLPFTPVEDSLVTAFCLNPPSNDDAAADGGNSLAVDWRLSKLVAESRSVDALEFVARARHASAQRGHTNGGGAGGGNNDARDRLLKAVESNLTTVEKTRLQLELAAINSGSGGGGGAATVAQKSTTSSSTLATLTHPAWAPMIDPSLSGDMDHDDDRGATDSVVSDTTAGDHAVRPSTAAAPAAPPRTLAELRQQRLPPAPAPKPTAADLPLSASPFVRRRHPTTTPASSSSHVQQQQTPRKGAGTNAFTGPLGVTPAAAGARGGSPFRRLGSTLQNGPASTTTTTTSAVVAAANHITASSSHAGSGSTARGSPPPPPPPQGGGGKPTLSGFGSVRKPVAPASIAAAQQVANASTPSKTITTETPRRQPTERDDEDVEMRGVQRDHVASSREGGNSNTYNDDDDDDEEEAVDFAQRAAKDPAIQRTIQAAAAALTTSSSSSSKSSSSRPGQRVEQVETAAASAKRGATPARKTTRRADKRRAVHGQPPHEDRVDPSRTEQLTNKSSSSSAQLLLLPPGAFPGGEEDGGEGDTTTTEESERERPARATGQRHRGSSSTARGPAAARRSSSSSVVIAGVAAHGEKQNKNNPDKGGNNSSAANGTTVYPPATPAPSRRTTRTRSRASTAEPGSPPPPSRSRSRRTTRASSVQARESLSTEPEHEHEHEYRESAELEMRQVESTKGRSASIPPPASHGQGKTPVRRSSRLRSGHGAGVGAGRDGARGKIEEASEEE
ncbi:hypothetical protein JCM3774_004629 [Rhodotorula dairenensis]